MSETFVVPASLGKHGLKHKLLNLRKEGYVVRTVIEGSIPQAGSTSTPYAKNYGQTEPGWIIEVDRSTAPCRQAYIIDGRFAIVGLL